MKPYYLHISYAYKVKGMTCIGDCFGIYRSKGLDELKGKIVAEIEKKNGLVVEELSFISFSVLPERLYRSLYPKQDEK